MELFTLNRQFLRQETLDRFMSAIWTERYYGDGEIELVVEPSAKMFELLKPGTFIGLVGSDEIMMLETRNIEAGRMKVTGLGLMQFLNNRFVRTSAAHQDRYWYIAGWPPGEALANIVYYMAIGGQFLDGTVPTGVSNPQSLIIPGLSISAYDSSGGAISVGIPFGPLYDALKELATTYRIGMQIRLLWATEAGYGLGFRSYKGLDRTSGQVRNAQVRFSPEFESLTDIKELQSITGYKTLVYSFAPSNPGELATVPGQTSRPGAYGFDLRAQMVFAEDITTDQVGSDPAVLLSLLNSRAQVALSNADTVNVVDGQITPMAQFHYGVDYNLGDIVELQGNTGALQNARITEYIRVQDDKGERAYPTVAVIE